MIAVTEPQTWTARVILAFARASMITFTTQFLTRSIYSLTSRLDAQFMSLRGELKSDIESVQITVASLNTQMHLRFDQMDRRFEQVDKRFERLESQVDNLERDVQAISKQVFPE